MGLGQTMLTAAFLVLITIAAMNANKMIVDRDQAYYEQEAYRQAAIMAENLIGEILSKKFDENALSGASDTYYQNLSSFSTSLGPDWWEGYNIPTPDVTSSSNYQRYYSIYNPGIAYDDVDDYNGYTRSGASGNLTNFSLSVSVSYAMKGWSGGPDSVIVTSTTPTYLKKIDVTVMNLRYLPIRDFDGDGTVDTLKLYFSSVKSY